MRKFLLTVLVCCSPLLAFANNPGQHNIFFTWQDPTCDADLGTCTFNMYQALTTGACGVGKNPVFKGIVPVPGSDSFTQTNVTPGTYFTAFTAVDLVTGGESTCSNEVQTAVQGITTKAPTGVAGAVQ